MHNGCVLWGGVGTGKTIAALAYAQKAEPERQIVVVTTAKKRDSLDWQKEAAKMLISPNDFQVTSWNKIDSLVGYEDHFFIFDEQRLVGTGAWVKAFYKIAKKNRWILLSATPGDTWSDYAPMFIANGWYKNITEFRREHAVYSRFTTFPKIERWINEGKLQKYRKRLLVEMPMVRHTTRHIHHVECDYDKETLDLVRKRRWNIFEDKPCRNAAELYGVMRKVVSSDPDRVRKIQGLIKDHPKLIVFYNFNYELDMLREMCRNLEHSLNQEEEPWESTISMTSAAMRTDLDPQTLRLMWSDPMIPSRPDDRRLETRVQLARKHSASIHTRRKGMTLQSTSESLAPANRQKSSTKSSSVDRLSETTAKSSAASTRSSETTRLREHITPSSPSQTPPQSSFGWAEWNGHKHEPLPDTDIWIYLVQYTSGSEGWNCTETDAMAFWSLTYSWKQFHQAQGRIDRLNTPYTDLHYYVLMTDSVAEKPVMKALDQKKDFQPK